MTQSTRYLIHQLLVQTLATAVADASTEVLSDPKLPIARADRKRRIVFVLNRVDRLENQPGQLETRSTRQVLGVLLLPDPIVPADQAEAAAKAECDALHFQCRAVLKRDSVFKAMGDLKAKTRREAEIEPELQQIGMDGVLLYSAYEIEYRETYPAA